MSYISYYTLLICMCSNKIVLINHHQRPKAEGLSKKWVAIFFAKGSNFDCLVAVAVVCRMCPSQFFLIKINRFNYEKLFFFIFLLFFDFLNPVGYFI